MELRIKGRNLKNIVPNVQCIRLKINFVCPLPTCTYPLFTSPLPTKKIILHFHEENYFIFSLLGFRFLSKKIGFLYDK